MGDEASRSADLAGRLRARAREEGFDAIGIASAARLDRDGLALERWLAADRHASMAWMARDPARRADPRRLVPGCRSVVALATHYWPGQPQSRARAGRARVALYAQHRDYHRVIGCRARRLAVWLEAESGEPARACVDTAPVLERGWAERAGLGWIGKNACLLTRDGGSWLLLAEILSVAELESDPPHAEFCGSCTACIEACPTAAIGPPGTVDSSRCIAYWTIEHRGAIPEPQRAGIGDWIFGCDICQEVCPWNERFAAPVDAEHLERREDLRDLDPAVILALDERAFRERFSGTPLMRSQWKGMRRNACIVLGNLGDARARPALERALADDDPVVREHAAWALARLDSSDGGAEIV